MTHPPEGNDNADWGRTAETAACERWPLERISGDADEPWWYDARVCERIDAAGEFGDVEPGTPVEVKVAKYRIPNDTPRRGRWLLRERAHEQLLSEDGEYVLGVRREGEGVGELVMRPAWWVDDLVTTWSPATARRSGRRVAQIPWSRVFEEGDEKGIASISITNKGGATS
ncbi:hypothetical protein [Halococcus saccharolyticus]|uniref:Uncharacterized protein n=1 Tax=Halococcus saccharolyticus DSM 5350 TaxID=1227455 RepID=M0MA62_9EURY|nr:hypothetical protein [Halococcus saccharolyticus]EMA42682.1 hypothetical protein C449_16108 [Halococcus saccharolyticus DSM 5350]